VFIVGMPRSGTSLVEQILASHPAVHGAGELPDFDRLATTATVANPAIALFPECIGRLTPAQLTAVGERYLARLRALAPEAQRVTDKMPINFRHLGLIRLALPQARIIHVRRDPVDTCLSCYSILFMGNQPHAYELGELGRYYHSYQRLMAHWRTVLPPDAMLEVDYEDVVADLEGQARRMVAYCGLDWDAACLSFHRTQRPVRTASAVQVRQPIYRDAIGRWRPAEVELRPLLDGLAGAQPTP
jgi:Sulfotransferase family